MNYLKTFNRMIDHYNHNVASTGVSQNN
jgi:hypothetical protein